MRASSLVKTNFREPNLTDIYRLTASFTIVWFHSSLLYNTPSYFGVQYFLNNFLLSWALVFFYASTAKFALLSNLRDFSLSKITNRVLGIMKLMLVFACLYEALRYFRSLFPGFQFVPLVSLLSSGLLGNRAQAAFDFWKTVNSSPAYFLFYVLLIYFYALFFSLLYKHCPNKGIFGGIILISSVSLLIFYSSSVAFFLGQMFLLDRELVTMPTLAAFSYVFLVRRFGTKKTIWLPPLKLGLLLILPIALFTWSQWFWQNNFHWRQDSLFLLTFVLLVILNHYSSLGGSLAQNLSAWGQKYSLGIFLLHPFALAFLDHLIPDLLALLGLNSVLLAFVAINLSGFFLALVATKILLKHVPAIVTI